MPLTQNFSATQSLADSNEVTITDTSTGTDATITTRRVYILKPDGDYLVESGTTTDYEVWAYADSSITLDVLTRSRSVSIQVDWLNSGGSVVYTKTLKYAFVVDDDLFIYGKIQEVAGNNAILSDTSYYEGVLKMIVELEGAEKAIELAGDTAAAQSCLDRNYQMILHEENYF